MNLVTVVDACRALMDGGLEHSLQEIEYEEGLHGGTCEARHARLADGKTVVIFCSEASSRPGRSAITNAAPAPWEAAEDEIDLSDSDTVVWVEHRRYPSQGGMRDTFDIVTMRGRIPAWKNILAADTRAAA